MLHLIAQAAAVPPAPEGIPALVWVLMVAIAVMAVGVGGVGAALIKGSFDLQKKELPTAIREMGATFSAELGKFSAELANLTAEMRADREARARFDAQTAAEIKAIREAIGLDAKLDQVAAGVERTRERTSEIATRVTTGQFQAVAAFTATTPPLGLAQVPPLDAPVRPR